MAKLYRTMKADAGGLPAIGRPARMLGVRVGGEYADVHPDDRGFVHPGRGGMSVTVADPAEMPVARRPRWLRRGAGEDPLFSVEAARIVPPLAVRQETGAHALVEPAFPRPLREFERDLGSTQDAWRREPGEPTRDVEEDLRVRGGLPPRIAVPVNECI